jgi:hypothetical protein
LLAACTSQEKLAYLNNLPEPKVLSYFQWKYLIIRYNTAIFFILQLKR